jgi:tetratricopeptide (TPR) repeat protein
MTLRLSAGPFRGSRGLTLALLLAGGLAAPLAGQQREGDEAWNAGRYDDARVAYQQVLETDPNAGRANLRMGILLSWQGKLDSALILLARARKVEPTDTDVRLAQARVLAWHQQYAASIAGYDSLLADQPDLRAAELGRAQTLSWWGRLRESAASYRAVLEQDSTDLEARIGVARVAAWRDHLSEAEAGYRRVLEADPNNVEALVGLGYVYHWQGREGPAERRVKAALAVDSTNADARKLQQEVRTATRSTVESSSNWSNDSDHNTSLWQTVSANARAAEGVRVFGSAGALHVSDPARDATRVGGEAGLSWAVGRIQLTGAAGARRLSPEIAGPRTAATYRGRFSYRPVPRFGLSAGYARVPFDETAGLFEQGIDLETLEAGFDLSPAAGLSIYGGGGGTWFSDGNDRTGGVGGITQTFRRRFFIGAFGRTLSYDHRELVYFSPDRFRVLEGQAGYNLDTGAWDGRLSGGLGGQQIGKGGDAQTEWHIEGRIGRRWGSGNRIEAFGGVTNSAVSSTVGAFRYRTAGIILRLGL